MSCNSLKSVLDAEFSEMVTEKKKKVSKMSKVAEVRRVCIRDTDSRNNVRHF